MLLVEILKCGMSLLCVPLPVLYDPIAVRPLPWVWQGTEVQGASPRGSFKGNYIMNVSLPGTIFRLSDDNFARFHFKAKGASRI